jgi:spermidine synthase
MPAITFIFFLSGLSALVYQLLWMRHLGFIFGNTVYASATVLTAFMGGLALGSHVFGKYAERLKNPVKWFAALEWIIAGYAFLMPFIFAALQQIYKLAHNHISDSLAFLTPFRFVLAVLVLLVPTVCMGGTLPVMIRGLARSDEDFGRKLGWLYGVNTLGAVAGVFLCGFYLIPAVGLTMTNWIAVGTDVAAGIGAWAVARRFVIVPSASDIRPPIPRFPWSALSPDARFAVVIAFFCGFISLALEVIWFRALILVFGSTTYSFSVMLGVFLLGMSIGSLLIGFLLDRMKRLVAWLAVMLTAIGLYTLLSLYTFDRGPDFLLAYLLENDFSWAAMSRARFYIALFHLAVPALFFGAAFTTATRIVRHESASSPGATGFVYAVNTLGAVLGSFAGGFILLPMMGMAHSLLAMAVASGGLGLVTLARHGGARILRAGAWTVVVAIAALLVIQPPAWNPSLLTAGAYFGPFNFVRDGEIILREKVAADRLLFYKEALASTVSVHLDDGEMKYFCIDGKTEADETPRSMVLQRMIGHLPMLFHPDAQKAVNIGLGAGVSFGALSRHPLEHVEVVEIEPTVKHAVRAWGALNHHVLDHPDIRITVNDGRNHLFATTNRYDVIAGDPFEPVMAGAAHLYTVDYFKLAHARLNEGGIIGQYLPLYELSLDDYLMIVRSFVEVFPNTALFYTGFDTILLGFKGEMQLDANVLRRNFERPEVKASLEDIGFSSPEMILSMFVADLSAKPDFAGSGPLNTDEFPHIEFSAPKSALRYTTDENQAALLAYFTPIPDAWLEGVDDATAERLKQEHEAVRLMLQAAIFRGQGRSDEAFILLAQANEIAPSNPVVINEMVAMLVVSAKTLQRAGENEEAVVQFQTALRLDPRDFWSMYHMIELGMLAGQTEFASNVLDHALSVYPESPLLLGQKGKFLFSVGQQSEGITYLIRATEGQPGSLKLWSDLRLLAGMSGQINLAKRAEDEIARIKAFINR